MPISGTLRCPVESSAAAAQSVAHGCDLMITGKRPIIVLLPGVQGSHLVDQSGTRVLSMQGLVGRAISQIGCWNHITQSGVLHSRYGSLIRHLSRSFDVVSFPYDWRKSTRESACRLNYLVNDILNLTHGSRQPIHLLGHSMGGLVARRFIANHRTTWLRILAQNDASRLMMLGTPNGGSASTICCLTGHNPVVRLLQSCDRQRPAAALLNDMCAMPGLLELLPDCQSGRFFKREFWANMADAAPQGWVGPTQEDLDNARRATQTLGLRASDAKHMIYIAGQAASTALSVDLDRRNGQPELRIVSTNAGDGRVGWRTGQLLGVPTWYAPSVQHRALPKESKLFSSINQLLNDGRTDQLPQTVPITAGETRLMTSCKVLAPLGKSSGSIQRNLPKLRRRPGLAGLFTQ